MNLVVNGKSREIEAGTTMADLISSLGLSDANVVVELNSEALERSRYDNAVLGPGDVVEIVRAVQGG